MSSQSFQVLLNFQGKNVPLNNITSGTTANEIYNMSLDALQLSSETQLKLLYKGKRLSPDPTNNDKTPVFNKVPTKVPKILVMATSAIVAKQMHDVKSDPTIRGFDQEKQSSSNNNNNDTTTIWGSLGVQSKEYKFCRFQACTWQSFGHRTGDKTPHAFQAMQLLQQLATDPGVVAVMCERELVVGTLGEMDPIDDRIMQKKQAQGGCLLGYNTNGGTRIDIKLRTDDLQNFRPYPQLVATLLHELSHNWVGEHNLLFWTNYAQMRAEYLYTHARLRSTLVNGKTTAELAGFLSQNNNNNMQFREDNVFDYIMHELVHEMAQHGLHPNMIVDPIRQRIQELASQQQGQRLGGGGGGEEATDGNSSDATSKMSTREAAYLAAQRRANQNNSNNDNNSHHHNNNNNHHHNNNHQNCNHKH